MCTHTHTHAHTHTRTHTHIHAHTLSHIASGTISHQCAVKWLIGAVTQLKHSHLIDPLQRHTAVLIPATDDSIVLVAVQQNST